MQAMQAAATRFARLSDEAHPVSLRSNVRLWRITELQPRCITAEKESHLRPDQTLCRRVYLAWAIATGTAEEVLLGRLAFAS